MDAYRVLRKIGEGSYGDVYLIEHIDKKKEFVVKQIELGDASEKERKAAEQEASLLSRLKHPNIVAYQESFQDERGILHIVMAYCDGGDLQTRLKARKGRPLSERQIMEWFVQIALALQYLHDQNILHRDLKTQNIFLNKRDIVKVGDLGIARILESPADMATTLIGTPYYMSPELFSNQPYNYKSDVWSLGCVVYEMTTLKHAFSARNMSGLVFRILRGKIPPMPTQYSLELCELIQAMLSQSPAKRPSINRILRNEFVKVYMRQFVESASAKKSDRQSKRGRDATKQSARRTPSSSSDCASPASPPVLEPMEQRVVAPSVMVTLSGGKQNGSSGEQHKPHVDVSKRRPLPPTPPHLAAPRRGLSKQVKQPQASERGSELQVKGRGLLSNSKTPPGGVPNRQTVVNPNEQARARRRKKVQKDSPVLGGLGALSGQVSSDSVGTDAGEEEIDGTFVVHPDAEEGRDVLCNLLSKTLADDGGDELSASLGMEDSRSENPSGRLMDRIISLERSCVKGLGDEVMEQALVVLNKDEVDSEETEKALLGLLGSEQFSKYSCLLSELQFCKHSLLH
ncbi:serine/threonine-protein kinase Nek4-like isoform X2 [Oscarella lobularis]|uniref:serine/threonine-protein kinase Nek4-like isoform X2 n=1 Tax=Oscarella lobularis TaxID=121494 RepID=UPI0033140D9C